jgi:REP element-mobilizing transposase RayT
VNQVFLYCLAIAAERCAVTVHGFCVLSNHYHLVVTDHQAELPKMMEWLNGTLARCLNSRLGRWENFWAPGTYSRVELGSEADLLSELVYTLVNPVAAGLVPSGREWPGARSGTLKDGPQRITVTRPEFFFSEEMPEEVELVVEAPRTPVDPDAAVEFARALEERVEQAEQELRRKMAESGRAFLGVRGILATTPESAPKTLEPRRNLSPLVAAKDKQRRLELLEFYAAFLREYSAALKQFASGVRDVLFPAGTYRLLHYVNVRCRGPS